VKTDDVPQDANRAFAGHTKALYAMDETGRYRTIPSSGWEPEQIVLDQALAALHESAAHAHARALNGETAPLEYPMWARRMDVPTLAQTAGFFQWQVRRHLRPDVFRRLARGTLQRYAAALGCTVDELTTLPGVP
jgi:hypothetical protein